MNFLGCIIIILPCINNYGCYRMSTGSVEPSSLRKIVVNQFFFSCNQKYKPPGGSISFDRSDLIGNLLSQ